METPLQRLCRNINTCEDVKNIKLLLDHGANYLLPDKNDITPAMYICNTTDGSLFDHFLKIIWDINMPLNPARDTVLHIVVRTGLRMRVLKVLDRRPNVNKKNKEGDTPVHVAVSVQHHGLLVDLVEHGGDINAHSNFNLTPLHLVGKTGCSECLNSVLKCSPNVNRQDSNGHTPLMFFLKFHHTQIHLIKALIDHGADPTITDIFGYNCLHYITSVSDKGRYSPDMLEELTRLFIECGTDIDYRFSNSHLTALHIAITRGSRHMVYILLRHGASLKMSKLLDETPVDSAILRRKTSVLTEVLSFVALSGKPLENFLNKKIDYDFYDIEAVTYMYDMYRKEIDVLKQLQVNVQSLTLYALLTSSVSQIAIYLNQGFNLEYFDCLNFSDYPRLYRKYISDKIKDAEIYRVAVNRVHNFLAEVFMDSSVPLPDLIVYEITRTLGFYEVLRFHRMMSVQA